MSSVPVETRIPHIQLVPDSVPLEIPVIPLSPQETTLLPEEDAQTNDWGKDSFQQHIQDARNGNTYAVHQLAELSTTAIQNGNLADVLNTITDIYEGDKTTQTMARNVVMRQYMTILDENNMGIASYDAVTHSPSKKFNREPNRRFSQSDPIDPHYPTAREE